MIRLLIVLFAIVGPAGATQQGWPALHDVIDVAEDDVLNIRALPDATADIIGMFNHDAKDIEVIRPDEDWSWGLVNLGEQSGWVSLRFLAAQPGQWDGSQPRIQACYGTEPFWDLSRSGDKVTFSIAFDDYGPMTEYVTWEDGTLNHRNRFAFATANLTGFISRAECNDGMSEREFGLDLNLVVDRPDGRVLFQGCCTIQPRAE